MMKHATFLAILLTANFSVAQQAPAPYPAPPPPAAPPGSIVRGGGPPVSPQISNEALSNLLKSQTAVIRELSYKLDLLEQRIDRLEKKL